MTLARPSPSDAELWRRLVFWSRASDWMIGGCAGGCTLTVAGSALLLVLGARAAHLLAAAAALGVALEGVRRACDLARRRALDAAAPRLLSTRGLSREAVEQAAAALGSGRIEELDASLAFESDRLHCAVEAALGRAGASPAVLREEADGARAVVVGLGRQWAAVLRFTNDDLREARVHERLFTWNEGAGPRRLDLPIDADARASLERSMATLASDATSTEPSPSPRRLDDGGLAIGIAVVGDAGRLHTTIGAVDLAGAARPRPLGARGGPYRALPRSAADASPDVERVESEIEIEGQRRLLALAPRDESAPNVFAHAILQAAARLLPGLVVVEPPPMEKKGRPLRVDGVPLVAGTRRGSEWIDALATFPEIDRARRSELSDRWLRAALAEHSSIFAFERLASVLSILGAPAELVDRTRAAGDDEGRHARDAFSLAAAYGGDPVGPGPLRVPDAPPPSIDALAIETFFDGCVGETLGARQASAALTRCRVPAARDALDRVAIDERRHAELAWDMLAWLLPRTSAQARATIAAACSPPPSANGAGERDRRDDAWLAEHGWLTGAEEDAVEVVAWRDEVGPRRDALLAEPCARQAGELPARRLTA